MKRLLKYLMTFNRSVYEEVKLPKIIIAQGAPIVAVTMALVLITQI
jgi:hypothetical protein